ncbi:RICIN domain-containing protein [Streptomyces sp. SYSU K217416]
MRGAAGDPGGALTPRGGGQHGRTNTSPAGATSEAAGRTQSPASEGSANEESAGKDAGRATGERTNAAEGEPEGTSEPAASTSNSAAAASFASSASSASSASTPSASVSTPTAVLATVSTTGPAPDAAMAASGADSGGSGESSHDGDEPPGSRPKKPMLAAAAIAGAILIAVPFLVAGQDDRKSERTRTENAAGTVLDTERSAVPDTYTSESPAPSVKPSKKKQKPAAPALHKQRVAPSPSAFANKPKTGDTPKTASKPKTGNTAKANGLTPAEELRQWANGRSSVKNTVIKNAATGQCVDLAGYGKGKINNRVLQNPCNATTADNQLWNLDVVDKDGGPQNAPLFLIRNSKDGLCLDLGYYKARSAGTKVGEFTCRASGDNQLWWLDPRGDGTNWIRNAVSNDLCLRPTGGAGAGNDAALEIASCGSGDRWIV